MSEEFQTSCPGCNARLRVPNGGKFMCPKCGRIFVVDSKPATPAAPETPAIPATGIDCENHPGVAATAICRTCGKLVCPACHADVGGQPVCATCAARKDRATAPSGVAWETPGEGFFHGFGTALIEPLIRPDAFFATMDARANVGRAFLFGFLVRVVVGFLALVIQTLTMRALLSPELVHNLIAGIPALRALGPEFKETLDAVLRPALGSQLAMGVFLVPLSAAGWLLVESLLLHAFLLPFGGARNGLEATLKVNAYSSFVGVLTLVPGIGALGYVAWKAVILIVGLAQAHRTPRGRIAAAVLIPPIVFLFLCFVLGILIVLGLVAAIGGAK
jgi:hypothetical protein